MQRRTHAQTERRSCRLILPSPMLLWCSLAAPKLASTYNRAHGTMKEEHDERGGRRKRSRAQFSHITMRVTHANLLLRSPPAHYRTYQRDPKVHQPGWPAGWTSRARMRRRRRRRRRPGPREVAVLVTPTLPILPPPPPVMPPVVVVVPSAPSAKGFILRGGVKRALLPRRKFSCL